MRSLPYIDEFKAEAGDAVFTKQQAVAATLQLLQKEQANPDNNEAETALFANAIAKAEFRYIDATVTETDRMLDGLGVARFTTQSIVDAIKSLLFDVQ